MRDVNYGWLIRYMHTNGASLFFLACYIHMLRGLYYGSFKPPRELLWIIGVIIYFLMAATAFLGYVLPWGSMSFAGATVITNLVTAIPVVGTADRALAVGRLRGRRPDPQPLLLAALPAAVRHRRLRRAACLGAARRPARTIPDGVEVKNVERDTVAVHALRHDQGPVRGLGLVHPLRLADLLHPELSARRRQLQHRQPAGDAGACRAGMVPAAVLRDPARHPEQAAGRHRARRRDRDPGLRALARPQSRSSRRNTARPTGSSSGCSSRSASASAGSARRSRPTR